MLVLAGEATVADEQPAGEWIDVVSAEPIAAVDEIVTFHLRSVLNTCYIIKMFKK